MRALLLLAGVIIVAGAFFVGVVVGRAATTAVRVGRYMKQTGVSTAQIRIYKRAIEILHGLVAVDDITDLMVDPEEQVRLPFKTRGEIDQLLVDYRKENL